MFEKEKQQQKYLMNIETLNENLKSINWFF